MPKDLSRENVPLGKIVYQWTVKEYEEHERGKAWHIIMIILGLAVIAYSIITANYLFAMIIILFGIILYIHGMQPPLPVPIMLTETGIVLGKKYYRFSEFASFWVIYNPPAVKNLYFTLNNVIKHRLQIPLLDYDPQPIRNFLNQYLQEDLGQEDEPLSDQLARLFKLH